MKIAVAFITILILTQCQHKVSEDDLLGTWQQYTFLKETDSFSNLRQSIEFKENGDSYWRIEFWKPSVLKWKIYNDSIYFVGDSIKMKGTVVESATNGFTMDLIVNNGKEIPVRVELKPKD